MLDTKDGLEQKRVVYSEMVAQKIISLKGNGVKAR
jgi:hypothetical protein